MAIRAITLLLISFLFAGCTLFSTTAEPEEAEEYEIIYPEPDPDISQTLDTYRDSLNRKMGVRIATVTDTMRFDQPEGALGNLAADALRYRAAGELRKHIHTGIIGADSFKLFFTPGILTLGEVYEFMPYDNHLVVLTLDGRMMRNLINEVAKIGGAPVSGVRFTINGDSASGILVNSEVIEDDRLYYVATSSYLANGGDQFSALWNPVDREDLDNISIRDLYVNHFRNIRVLNPVIDGRIRK